MEEAAQLSLAKRLAHSSDKAIRDEAFKTLALWLEGNKSANEEEYLKVWKALFYSMWYSDKIPVQQELAFNIARLTRSLKGDSRAVLFLSTFFATLSREWIGIDHLRMDKYLSLTRRMLHEAIRLTAQASFSAETLAAVEGLLAAVLAGRPNGIRYHIVDCFLEEVGAAAPGIRTEQLQRLLAPLYAHCVVTDDRFLYERVAKEVVQGLLQRTTDAQAPASEGADDEEEGSAGAIKASESPLLIDAAARRAALASAFKQIKLAPIACDVFALAAFSCTQGSHRERLYALHREAAAAALALGHAKEESETYPRPVGTPTPTVQRAIDVASARSGRKLTAEAAAAAAAVVKAAEAAVEKATVSAAAKAKSLEAHRKKKEQRKKWREEAAAAGPDVDDAAEEEAAEAKAAAASAAAGGAKRSRREMERAAAAAAGGVGASEFAGAEIRGSKRARATEAAAAAAAGAGAGSEEEASSGAAAKPVKGKKAAGAAGKATNGAARAAPPAAAAEAEEGASVEKAAPRPKKGKPAGSSAPAAAAPAAEQAGEDDAMALLAAIPTVGQLKKGKAPAAKAPAAAEVEAPAAAPSKKAPAGILKSAAAAGKAGKVGNKGR